MAFSDLVVAVARETKLFVGLEATPGTQVAPTAGGMQTVLLHQAGSVSQAIRHIDDPQFRNTRSRLAPIVASYDPGKFSFPCLIKTVAGSGSPTTPEIDGLLTALMGLPAGTDATWFGSTPHRSYKLLGVSPGGTQYPSFTAWFQVGHTCFYIVGATCNQGAFNIVGNALSDVAFTGEFMRHGWMGTDRPAGTGSGTSLQVIDAKKYFLASANDRLYIGIWDGSTLNGPYTVTAVNYSTNTLTLGGGASWNANDLVVPMLPAPAEVGRPLYGKFGLFQVGAYASKTFGAIPGTTQIISGFKMTITNGIKYHADLKDDSQYPTEYVAPAFREVAGELQLFMYRNTLDFNYKAEQDPLIPDYILAPTTDKMNSAGRRFEIHVPNAIWMTPAASGEDEKTMTIPFKGTATTDYDDELALVYYGG